MIKNNIGYIGPDARRRCIAAKTTAGLRGKPYVMGQADKRANGINRINGSRVKKNYANPNILYKKYSRRKKNTPADRLAGASLLTH